MPEGSVDVVSVYLGDRPEGTQSSHQRAAVRAGGAGTPPDPLRVVMVLRHADMADEVAVEQAQAETEAVLRAIQEALAVPSGRELTTVATQALLAGQQSAAWTGTYFSALAAVLAGSDLAAAGIGMAGAWIARPAASGRGPEALLPPSVYSHFSRPVLTASLGLGFAPERMLGAHSRLQPGEFALLAVDPAVAGPLDWERLAPHSGMMLEQMMARARAQLGGEPAVLAVVRSPPG